MFYDLCCSDFDGCRQTYEELGYSMVVEDIEVLSDQLAKVALPNSNSTGKLNRLTIATTNDKPINYNINTISEYDLIAVKPHSTVSFEAACKSRDIDIIVVSLEKLDYKLKHTTLNLALQNGIHFEIQYSGAISHIETRRNMISNATQLIRAAKGKNILVSSGAKSNIYLRSPQDVMNMCNIFGMSVGQAKAAISGNGRQVLFHGETRRNTYRGIISTGLKRKTFS